MAQPVPALHKEIHFGAFTVDVRSRELRKNGMPVKLQDRPFQILTILLENPGSVVTRDDLRSRLWAQDTFVDFDHGISTAIRKLRDALNDSAATPRYVETVGRRGYRFIYPVTFEPVSSVVTPITSGSAAQAPDRESLPAAAQIETPEQKSPRSLWLGWPVRIAALSAAALAGVAIFTFNRSHARFVISPADPVILADIENRTGNSAFDGSLLAALRVKLNESPFFTLVPEPVYRAQLKKQNLPDHPALQAATRVCQELGAKAVISGEIASAPRGGFEVQLSASRCADGRKIAAETGEAGSAEDIISSLGVTADKLRRQMGEPAESLEQFHTPLSQATTSSVAALRAFSLGEERRAEGQDFESVGLYQLATDLDPGFALAYARLGVIYGNAQEYRLSKEYFQKAFDNRDRSTERERLYLTAHYYAGAGDGVKSVEVYELWRQIYPQDVVPANNLADGYLTIGNPQKAVEMAKEAFRLKPENGIVREILMESYQRAGRFEEAKKLYDDTVARKLDGIHIHFVRYDVAFGENDEAEMQRQMQWAQGNPREGEMLDHAAWGAASRGELRHAHDLFQRGRDTAIKNDLKEFAGAVILDEAQVYADFGLDSEARAAMSEGFRLAHKPDPGEVWSALVLARIGETHRAEILIAKVVEELPHDTVNKDMAAASARALCDLRSNPAAAVQRLQLVEPYDLARASMLAFPYYRGLAYLAAKDPQNAITTFQKILKNRHTVPQSPYVPLGYVGLARAYRMAGDKQASREAYEQFFALWKNADRDIPALQQARAEYQKLEKN